jgi:anti-sigma B factor antagonist
VTFKANTRQADGITIVDLSGSITSDEGSAVLRSTIQDLATHGSSRNILLNLGEITQVDTSGIGELVNAYTSVRNSGGELKLFNLSRPVHDLLQITKLCTVFDIQHDEASAIASFQQKSAAL